MICSCLTVGIATAVAKAGRFDPDAPRKTCMSNLKQDSLAMIMYAADADDVFPLKSKWMDNVSPYIRNRSIFHCPSVGTNQYGYAYNSTAAGKSAIKIESPATKPLVFDSKLLGRSAVATIASLPKPARHVGRNNIGYCDGHIQSIALR